MQRWYGLLGGCMSAELGTNVINVDVQWSRLAVGGELTRTASQTAELERRNNVELPRLNSVEYLGVLHSLKK
jgi:hypothetical protein